MTFVAPFPWFGGKRTVAAEVWARFGDVSNYVEPFFGSGAVLLGRPGWTPDSGRIETVNDKDGFVSNFWRALKYSPDELMRWCDWPVNENDLHARHAWLTPQRAELTARLEGDPDYFDAKIAGWWLWGICVWIGSGWCSGDGPWRAVGGKLVKADNAGQGINRKRIHLGDGGRGIQRQLVHLSSGGQGEDGDGTNGLENWIRSLAVRLARVRVCSGDWSRVCGPTPTFKQGLTGVFFDPPYSAEADRDETLYSIDDLTVAHEVREWCIANGDNPLLRIALCGYTGEHDDDLAAVGWTAHKWKAKSGYGSQSDNGRGRANAEREIIWFSPHCLAVEETENQLELFA